MTAIAQQPSGARRERRIIERPRLIKLLDAAEQRTILLLAPAGYGKTTLARQWAKTLSRAIWITLTPAHRDVVTLAGDVAEGIDSLGGDARGFIKEYLTAQSNPQRAAREVGNALRDEADRAHVQWLILDDYHELVGESDSERVIDVLRNESRMRLLVASRAKPSWATPRGIVYGEEYELNQAELAMTASESLAVLGRTGSVSTRIADQARGWPAVVALAGAFTTTVPSNGTMLHATLHSFLADELFNSAPDWLKAHLQSLALLPDLSPSTLRQAFGEQTDEVLNQARALGFLEANEGVELHPLLKEFLLVKISESTNVEDRARRAVQACIDGSYWDQAVDLAERFRLNDLLGAILEAAYKPLVRSGRVGTLSRIGETLRYGAAEAQPEVELIDAEVALRNGEFRLAAQIVGRLQRHLTDSHPLRARASAIGGTAAFQLAEFAASERHFGKAQIEAVDDSDLADALHGRVLAAVYGEGSTADKRLDELEARSQETGSPVDVARHAASALARMRIGQGFHDSPFIEDALRVLPHIEDPRVRTSVMMTLSYCLGLQADYARSAALAADMLAEVSAFGLEFAKPHGDWNVAFAALGQRRFGDADKALQRVEDALARRPLAHHLLNARALRARLLMQQAQFGDALELVRHPVNDAAAPSMHAEYVAVRAVALALLGKHRAAIDAANLATSVSISSEVTMLAEGAIAIVAAENGDRLTAYTLIERARSMRIWDPVVSCLRSSPALVEALTSHPDARPDLERLFNQTNDFGLARRARIRSRNVRDPSELLSPREREVLELLAQGYRNRDIAAAFVISESTVKVHVRHVLEKLGVHTRTQAVARLKSLEG